MDHLLCIILLPLVGGLATAGGLILWALRGYKWLATGK